VSRGLPSLFLPRRLGRLPGGFRIRPGFDSDGLPGPRAAVIPLPHSRKAPRGGFVAWLSSLSPAAAFGDPYSSILGGTATMVAGSGVVLSSSRWRGFLGHQNDSFALGLNGDNYMFFFSVMEYCQIPMHS
jgi:hypothetical protein